MKKLFLLTMIVASLLGGSGVALAAGPTDAAKNQVCQGVNAGIPGSNCGGTSGGNAIAKVLNGVLQIITWIAGAAALIMIILAGLKYITSGGDSSAISSAKQSLVYAIVGVVIVVVAQILVNFVIQTAKQATK
jgi:hypothetical protein